MYKLETKPLTVSQVLKNGWELYKATIKYVILPSLVLGIIHVTPYLFGFVGLFFQEAGGRLTFSVWGLLLFLALTLIEAYFVAILFYTMYLHTEESKVDYAKVLRYAANIWLPLYCAFLFYQIAINIGFFMFILPSLFIFVLLSMFLPYLVIERRSLYTIFESSVKLVWGHWWQTFLVLVISYSLAYLARNFLQFYALGNDWILFVDLVVLTVAGPYFYAVLLVQFVNLKTIKSLPESITTRPRTEMPVR